MASSIRLARSNLYDLLAAAPALSTAQRTFGRPDAYVAQQVVAVLGFGPIGDEPAALGQRRQAETYRIEVAMKYHDPAATTGQAVEVGLMALYDGVWNVVHDNPTLNGAVTFAFPGGGDTSDGAEPDPEGGGWVAFASLFVECTARISR